MSKRPVRPTAVPTVALDRREFIAAASTAVAASVLPLSVAVAAHAHVEFDRLADWTIDDMWTGYPRPAAPIGQARRPAPGLTAADAGVGHDPQLLV